MQAYRGYSKKQITTSLKHALNLGLTRSLFIGNVPDHELDEQRMWTRRVKQDLGKIGQFMYFIKTWKDPSTYVVRHIFARPCLIRDVFSNNCVFLDFRDLRKTLEAAEYLQRHPDYAHYKIRFAAERFYEKSRGGTAAGTSVREPLQSPPNIPQEDVSNSLLPPGPAEYWS